MKWCLYCKGIVADNNPKCPNCHENKFGGFCSICGVAIEGTMWRCQSCEEKFALETDDSDKIKNLEKTITSQKELIHEMALKFLVLNPDGSFTGNSIAEDVNKHLGL